MDQLVKLLLAFTLVVGTLSAAAPLTADVTCDAPTPNSVRCNWLTAGNERHVLKLRTTSGGSVIHSIENTDLGVDTVHAVVVNAVTPSTTYLALACSGDTIGTDCAGEITVITSAALADPWTPLAPVAVDDAWPAGTGTTRTVGSNCLDPTTGLQRLVDDAALGDKIVIPMSTRNCDKALRLTDKGAGTSGILITTDGTRQPPPGVRMDCALFDCSTIHRSFFNYALLSAAELSALTGRVNISVYGPGSIIYAWDSSSWAVKKAALQGTAIAVTGATNATPIVLTTASAHGLANNDPACVTGVLGNLAANGCFKAQNVTATTMELQRADGTPQTAFSAYTSGGTLRTLTWQSIPTVFTNPGPVVGSCAGFAAGDWAHDTSASVVAKGMYRCGTDGIWHRVENNDSSVRTGSALLMSAAINADIGAHHYRFSGINFADVPIPPEPEYFYAPRRPSAGTVIGGAYLTDLDTHHIAFDQVSAVSDMAKWRTNTIFNTNTTDFVLKNSRIECGGFRFAYYPEVEAECTGVGTSGNPGPVLIHNNWIRAGGWGLFWFETGSFINHQNVTITRNVFRGVLDWAYPSSTYNAAYTLATGAVVMDTRQIMEGKTGQQFRISGNVFDGQAYSNSPVGAALVFGAQAAGTQINSISSVGVVNAFAGKPRANAVNTDMRALFFGNDGSRMLARVASVSSGVITLKNLNGTSYSQGAKGSGVICILDTITAIRDFEVTGNTIRNAPSGFTFFGSSYGGSIQLGCQNGPAQRIRISNNALSLLSTDVRYGWHSPTPVSPSKDIRNGVLTAATISGLTDYVTMNNNTARQISTAGFVDYGFAADNLTRFRGVGLRVRDNLLAADDVAVYGYDSGGGTVSLDARYPLGYTFTSNAFIRAGGTLSGQPAGNTYPAESAIAWANAAAGDWRMKASSAYRGQGTTDGYPAGHDIQALNVAQGRVQPVNATASTGSLTVRWKYDGGAACSVDASNNAWATYTRAAAGSAVRLQSATLTLAAGTWAWRVLCPGTVDEPLTGTATVP
jgi:hypothetical protein